MRVDGDSLKGAASGRDFLVVDRTAKPVNGVWLWSHSMVSPRLSGYAAARTLFSSILLTCASSRSASTSERTCTSSAW